MSQAFPLMAFILTEVALVIVFCSLAAWRHYGEWVILSSILVPAAMAASAAYYSMTVVDKDTSFQGDVFVYIATNIALAFVIGYFTYAAYRLSVRPKRARR